MPIKMVMIKGKKAYKYGSTGKTYTGRGARAKARTQGRAIELSRLRSSGRLIEKKGRVTVRSSKRAKGYRRTLWVKYL